MEYFKSQLKPNEAFLINKHMIVEPGKHDDFWTSTFLSKIETIEAILQNQGPRITRLLWKKSPKIKTVRWTPETADPVIKELVYAKGVLIVNHE